MSRALLILLASFSGALQPPAEPVRLSAEIGGERAIVEIRDFESTEATRLAKEALGVIAVIEKELSTANPNGAISAMNREAGRGPQPLDGDIGRMFQSVLGFCVWGRGANGPMGGRLYDIWESSSTQPSADSLERAISSANCQTLMLNPEQQTAALAAGSQIDLRHFANGYAVDRAMHFLHESGVANAFIEFRSSARGLGPGPAGRGWRVNLPILPSMSETLDPVYLRDRSIAFISTHRDRFRFGDLSFPPFLDQRTGQPAMGTAGVVVVSILAIDAQAIGSTVISLGHREGQLRLGGVNPPPSVLWLLGDGSGEPLLATFKWSETPTH